MKQTDICNQQLSPRLSVLIANRRHWWKAGDATSAASNFRIASIQAFLRVRSLIWDHEPTAEALDLALPEQSSLRATAL